MPSWNQLVEQFSQVPDDKKAVWLQQEQTKALQAVSARRGGRHVIFYASGFLQKPQAPAPLISITFEDINALMSVMHGMTWSRDLTLVLHTPGGMPNAAESIVAYLRSKFQRIEVVVPTFAMSAGTMISLSADKIIMGRQSQLGPIDPQFVTGTGALSAQAVKDQFETAKRDIKSDLTLAHLWAPVLQTIGPALLQEANNALDYGEKMVSGWLERYMFSSAPNAKELAQRAAAHFNDATNHKSHGRRIDRDEARSLSLVIEDLEPDQALQEAVLTAYHLMTITVDNSQATKALASDTGRFHIKGWNPPAVVARTP